MLFTPRPSPVRGCCALMVVMLAVAALAAPTMQVHADGTGIEAAIESQMILFDVPRQPLASALLVYAQQAQIQVVMATPSGAVADTESVELSGEFTPRMALERLLSGSRYRYKVTGPRTIVINVK